MKIGIYGGSFDPIHKGHLYVAKAAMNQFHLDKLIFMPSHHSPNKTDISLSNPIHRLKMCEIAVKSLRKSNFCVSDYEAMLDTISYTYLTLQHMKELYPDDELFFIMGADSLDYLDTWKHPEIICECAKILVLEREGFDINAINKTILLLSKKYNAKIEIINESKYNASSTDIRTKLLNSPNQCPNELPKDVYEYIILNHLYEA